MRSNGLPALRNLPIKFTRRAATTSLAGLVGKENPRAKHSPYEYVSEDNRWIIRAVLHSGHGSTRSGRVRWHVSHDGRYFGVGFGQHSYALSLEDAIDEIHRRIARGIRDGFKILEQIRQTVQAAEAAAEQRAANLVRARDLLSRVCGADPEQMIAALAEHVNLDSLARAVDGASPTEGDQTIASCGSHVP